MYSCPVCNYDGLWRPADDDLICPSCGVQFGLDDYYYSCDELRQRWVDRGSPWFSDYTLPTYGKVNEKAVSHGT